MKPCMASATGCPMTHILINICATYQVLWAWFRDRNVHLRWLGCHYLCWADTIRKHHLTAICLVDWNSWNTSINLHNTTKCQLKKVRFSNMKLQLVKGFLLTTVTCTSKINNFFSWHSFLYNYNSPTILIKIPSLPENADKKYLSITTNTYILLTSSS